MSKLSVKDVSELVVNLLAKQLEVQPCEIKAGDTLEKLGFDSLDTELLTIDLQDEVETKLFPKSNGKRDLNTGIVFRKSIDTEDLAEKRVAQIVGIVCTKLKETNFLDTAMGKSLR